MTNDQASVLGAQRFVSLTTFKRSGEGVPSAMWIGHDDGPAGGLYVWTHAESWKVRRVRNDPRVLLAPSGRSGKVRDGVKPVEGTAQLVTDPETVDRLQRGIRRKYGIEYRVVLLIERIFARGPKPRVVLRIALAPTAGTAPS